jgi:hypothetical protein
MRKVFYHPTVIAKDLGAKYLQLSNEFGKRNVYNNQFDRSLFLNNNEKKWGESRPISARVGRPLLRKRKFFK